METKEKIILTATKLFLNNGIKSVTMDSVAQELCISKRTIYENFADKHTLIKASVMYMLQAQHEREDELLSGCTNIVEELFALFSLVDEDFIKGGKFSMDIYRHYPDIFNEIYTQYHQKGAEKLKSRLERGIKQGIIMPDTNIEFAVIVVHETLHNIMLRSDRITTKSLSITDAFKYVLIFFFRGISKKKGIELIDQKMNS